MAVRCISQFGCFYQSGFGAFGLQNVDTALRWTNMAILNRLPPVWQAESDLNKPELIGELFSRARDWNGWIARWVCVTLSARLDLAACL